MEWQRKVAELSLFCLKLLDLNPFNKIKKTRVLVVFLSYLTFAILIYVKIYKEGLTFGLMTDTFEAAFSLSHALSKYWVFTTSSTSIRNVFQSTTRFWKLSKLKSKLQREIENFLKNLRLLLLVFIGFMSLAGFSFVLKIFATGDLAINCYIPEFLPRPIFILFHDVFFLYYAFTTAFFDVFLCSMIILIGVQFKVLNYEIAQLDLTNIATKLEETKCIKKMKKCVEYHIFLKNLLQELSALASPALLTNFCLAPIVFSFEVYFMFQKTSLVETMKSVLYTVGIINELFFLYCLPATFLMSQTQNMIIVVYNETGWENCYQLSIRKNLIIMMQRMQEETVLKAGKIVAINMTTYRKVFQTGFSFYTCLQLLATKNY